MSTAPSRKAKDDDEELPPVRDLSLAPDRREFDEEAFKATNEFYLKLVEANAPEQQRALLNMYKTVCAGEFLNVLIHGGPGTGKTFFMGVMQEALAKLNVHFIGDGIHSSGRTVHQALGLGRNIRANIWSSESGRKTLDMLQHYQGVKLDEVYPSLAWI